MDRKVKRERKRRGKVKDRKVKRGREERKAERQKGEDGEKKREER